MLCVRIWSWRIKRSPLTLHYSCADLFTEKTSLPRPSGPVGKVQKLFDEVAKLPRRQQDKIVEFLAPIIEDFKRKSELVSRDRQRPVIGECLGDNRRLRSPKPPLRPSRVG